MPRPAFGSSAFLYISFTGGGRTIARSLFGYQPLSIWNAATSNFLLHRMTSDMAPVIDSRGWATLVPGSGASKEISLQRIQSFAMADRSFELCTYRRDSAFAQPIVF
jgi:hypothetical protein